MGKPKLSFRGCRADDEDAVLPHGGEYIALAAELADHLRRPDLARQIRDLFGGRSSYELATITGLHALTTTVAALFRAAVEQQAEAIDAAELGADPGYLVSRVEVVASYLQQALERGVEVDYGYYT